MNAKEDFSDFKRGIEKQARETGYTLNPDRAFLDMLFDGLFKNNERYGYPSCPCRLAEGVFESDIDIICPCLYRDPDLYYHGRCYCGLYVNDEYIEKRKGQGQIPERRPAKRAVITKVGDRIGVKNVGERYRCNICGNEVTVTKVGGGVLVCCGEEMELIA